ncbi:hypothetical protein EMCRGX_G028262 [Ephydatia muelleri]
MHLRKPQATKPLLRPIVANGLLSRLQGNGTVLEDIAATTQEELAEDTVTQLGLKKHIQSHSLSTQKKNLEIRKKADAADLKAIDKMYF